ncbi:MAG: glutamine amidotransferase [Gammaproteobacteria bacterium]
MNDSAWKPRYALAIRHVHFEDCGSLAEVLLEHNFGIRYVDAGRHDLRDLDVSQADLVVSLGGPVGVYDTDAYPWIRDELEVLDRSVTLGKPVIGLCLGAQMLARVLGARVYPGPVKELGWKPLTLTQAGRASVIAPLGEAGASMLHWHGDTFDLPQEAQLLASTAEVANQVFQWRERVIGFQCHPEIQTEDIERWLIGHACEIGATPGASVAQLRADTARFAPALKSQASRMFGDWLTRVGFPVPAEA